MWDNNRNHITIHVSDDTTELMLENEGVKWSIWIIADVVTSMQDKISNWVANNTKYSTKKKWKKTTE